MELYGTHGTSQTRKSLIFQEGFKLGKRASKAGSGVYFWAAKDSEANLAYLLAKNWWEYAFDKGWYNGESDARLSVIRVKLILDDDDFLDCSVPDIQEELFNLAREKNVTDPKDFSGLYDMLIAKMEEYLGKMILVIKAQLTVPKNNQYHLEFHNLFFSNCASYIVRCEFERVITIDTDNSH